MVDYVSTNALSMLGGDDYDDVLASIATLNANVVHKTGTITESINGAKTFTTSVATTGTTFLNNLTGTGVTAFSLTSPIANACLGSIEAERLGIDTDQVKANSTTSFTIDTNQFSVVRATSTKIKCDDPTLTTSITDRTVNVVAADTAKVEAGTGNLLLRANGGNLVKLQQGTTEKMTLGASANIQTNTTIESNAVTSITDKIGGTAKRTITSVLTTNASPTITDSCVTRNINATGTAEVTTPIFYVHSGATDYILINSTDYQLAGARFRVDATMPVINSTSGAGVLIQYQGLDRASFDSSLIQLSSLSVDVVAKLDATEYWVGTQTARQPLCSIQYQGRHVMNTLPAGATADGFYQANWNSTFTNTTISNLFSFLPYGYEFLIDTAPAVTGVAPVVTVATITLEVYDTTAAVIRATASVSGVAMNNAVAQRFVGIFSSTTVMPVGSFQIRWKWVATSGTNCSGNTKGMTVNIYCQQLY